MFEKVIIAPDLFDDSYALIRSLPGLKQLGVRRCLLLQCINSRGLKAAELEYITPVFVSSLKEQQQLLEDMGYQVETSLLKGLASEEINRVAAEEDYGLIIVGARQRSLTSETFMGGVATEVIHHGQKPVLVIRMADNQMGESMDKYDHNQLWGSHVLFPTDFSQPAEHAFHYLLDMIGISTQRVTIIHVQDNIRVNGQLCSQLREFNKADNAKLKQLRQRLLEKGAVEVRTLVKYGRPSAEILKYIKECEVTLVVMGSQGRGFIEEVFLGSVSHNIARHSQAAVLLIPAERNRAGPTNEPANH